MNLSRGGETFLSPPLNLGSTLLGGRSWRFESEFWIARQQNSFFDRNIPHIKICIRKSCVSRIANVSSRDALTLMTLSLPFHNERFNRIYSTVHNNFWPCRNRAPLLLLTVIAISLFLCTFYLNSKIVHTSVSSTTSRYSLTERLAPDEPLYNHTHAYITSAYYYENSKSLGKNAVAMVIVMSQRTTPDLEKLELTVVGKRGNQTSRSLAQIKKEAPEETSCEYIMTSVQTVTLDNPETLEIEAGGVTVPVPFKRPRTWAHSPVIMCISPQFVAEKWQVFLMNIHVIRRYGGHLHVYITSIVEELFNTLKVYESWGSLTLDYWVRMKFAETKTSHKNPMKNVEWRNQAGAQTDCLLQYKEVADFVAFFDIDDILIPRLSHNYHQEFSSHFDAFPSYHSIFYQKRDVAVQKVLNASDFSFRHLFSTMEIRNETGYGKSIVDPLKYNSTWIHHSVQLPENKIYKVPNTELIHVKDVLEEEMDRASPFRLPKMFGTLTDPMIRETDLQSLDNDFQSAFADATFNSTSVKMVDHNYYAPIVFQCYNESFYHPYFVEKKGFEELCPNADSCVLPQRADIKCIHSDAEYISGPEMYPITFHYAVNPFWSREIGCFQ